MRRASLGRYDEAAVEELLERDPDPDAHLRACGVSAARPLEDAKARPGSGSGASARAGRPPLLAFARCFWRPVQHELMVPWAHRYLDEVTALTAGAAASGGRSG